MIRASRGAGHTAYIPFVRRPGLASVMRFPRAYAVWPGDEGDERHAATAVTFTKRLLTRQ